MKWLFDIFKDWAKAQGFLTSSFVDRGDNTSYDFMSGDFIKDNAWHEFDVSGIVPANAKAVLFATMVLCTATMKSFAIKKADNHYNINKSFVFSTVAGVLQSADWVCPIGPDGKLKYFVSPATWSTINLTIKGWWL